MASHTRQRPSSPTTHANDVDNDINVIFFHPEEMLSSTPPSSNSSILLPSPISPLQLPCWLLETTTTLQPLDTSLHRPPCKPSSPPLEPRVTLPEPPRSSATRLVDVTLSSPIELTALPQHCYPEAPSSENDSEFDFGSEFVQRPAPLYVRTQQHRSLPRPPPLAIPTPIRSLRWNDDVNNNKKKTALASAAPPLDLVEPRTRFTQILASSPRLLRPLRGLPGAPSAAADGVGHAGDRSYFSPDEDNSAGGRVWTGLVGGMTALRNVVKRHAARAWWWNPEGTRDQQIAWEMVVKEDEEAVAAGEDQAHQRRMRRLLEVIDEEVEGRDGVAFARREEMVVVRNKISSDARQQRRRRNRGENAQQAGRLKAENENKKNKNNKGKSQKPNPCWSTNPYDQRLAMHLEAHKRYERRLASGKRGCIDLKPCPAPTYLGPDPLLSFGRCRECERAQRRWKAKQAERRRLRKSRWLTTRDNVFNSCREALSQLAAWPTGCWSWVGEHRSLSWIFLLAIIALLVVGMVLAIGRLVQG